MPKQTITQYCQQAADQTGHLSANFTTHKALPPGLKGWADFILVKHGVTKIIEIKEEGDTIKDKDRDNFLAFLDHIDAHFVYFLATNKRHIDKAINYEPAEYAWEYQNHKAYCYDTLSMNKYLKKLRQKRLKEAGQR